MPARAPELPVENPSALIRSRIRERRIFEARFLCRQLGSAIEAREKHQLERELTDVLAQVNTLRQLAGQHIAEGRNDLAGQLYDDIEQLAIDVPGLAEEKRTLAGTEAIFAKISSKIPTERETATQAPAPPVVSEVPAAPMRETVRVPIALQVPSQVAEAWQKLQQIPRRWLLTIGLGCLVFLVFLLLLLRNPQNRQVSPVTAPLSNTSPQTNHLPPSVAEPPPAPKGEGLQSQPSLRE